MKLAILVSGTGSLLEAMIKDGLPIALVLADRKCRGLDVAKNAGIPALLVARKDFRTDGAFDRDAYTKKVVEELQSRGIELVAMAGFMTVFSKPMFGAYDGRILNTHPSLLPEYKGEQAVADALAAGAKETGCTIHVATLKLDDGHILAQEKVRVSPNDTVETLWERIKQKERRLYPQVIRDFEKRLSKS